MKIKNMGLPLLICGVMILFLLYVPERISGIYDEAMIGKPTVSKVQEEAAGNLPVIDRIKLLEDYGKDANIICMREVYSGVSEKMKENASVYFEGEPKQLSQEVVAHIQEEMDKLRQLSLLPEISLGDMEVTVYEIESYMDIRNDNKYLALANFNFRKEDEEVYLRYDTGNKKILACNYYGDTMITTEEDDLLVQKGWSEYLGIGMEEVERYYVCEWYKDVERGIYGMTVSFLF